MNMKRFKKFAAMVLALAMCFALAISASAEDGDTGSDTTPTYTITVTNAVDGRTYTAYKVFDAQAVKDANGNVIWDTDGEGDTFGNTEARNVVYTINDDSPWINVVKGYTGLTLIPSAAHPGTNVVKDSGTFSATDFAALLNTELEGFSTTDKAAVFAGTDNGANNTANITVSGEGYYFVDSNLGSLCDLVSASGNVNIVEKNANPTIKKYVYEDSNDTNGKDPYGKSATVDAKDGVDYKLVVNTGSSDYGTGLDYDYVITDTLDENMMFGFYEINITVKVGDEEWICGTTDTTGANPDFEFAISEESPRVVTITLLKSGKLASLDPNTNIFITYHANFYDLDKINWGSAYTNTAVLTVNNVKAGEDSAVVKTFKIGGTGVLTKVDGDSKEPLANVEFTLQRTEDNQYAVVNATNKRLTSWSETSATIKSDSDGTITVTGLDAGTYKLTEIKTNTGYNLLDKAIIITVTEDGITYQYEGVESDSQDGDPTSLVIENFTGTTLPSTGGMGTTIFYVVGGILVLGAGIVLVTKKRMANR
jgi:LPXTG-motif cell wall-anchored protein